MAIVRPRMKDKRDPTHITYQWGGDIIRYALDHGVDVLDITDPWAEYQNITPLLTQHRHDLLVYTGHGCNNYLATRDGCSFTNGVPENVCAQQCNKSPNLNLLKNVIVVTFSCHSASQLGKCAIKYGARAYVGFTDYMMFTTDSVGSENVFRDALLPMATELIDGRTAGEAVGDTKAILYAATKQWKPVKFMAIPLMWNHEYMEVLGDMSARLGG